jgi:hypothetical protein
VIRSYAKASGYEVCGMVGIIDKKTTECEKNEEGGGHVKKCGPLR